MLPHSTPRLGCVYQCSPIHPSIPLHSVSPQGLILGDVSRHASIKVRAQDLTGRPFVLDVRGWEARIFQHEYDHLQGVLLVDRVTQVRERGSGSGNRVTQARGNGGTGVFLQGTLRKERCLSLLSTSPFRHAPAVPVCCHRRRLRGSGTDTWGWRTRMQPRTRGWRSDARRGRGHEG